MLAILQVVHFILNGLNRVAISICLAGFGYVIPILSSVKGTFPPWINTEHNYFEFLLLISVNVIFFETFL